MEQLQKENCYKVAVVQMDTGFEKEKNWEKIESAIEKAAKNGAKVVSFPELMNIEAKDVPVWEMGEDLDGPTVSLLRKKAAEHQIYIHGGSMYETIPGERRCYNTSVFVDDRGEVLATYRKQHLFDVTLEDGTICAESSKICPGEENVTVDTPLGTFGFAICYDLRFPLQFQQLVQAGAHLIFMPASFTKATGRDHWEPLLRARAIENQCYILAANQTGEKAEYAAYGHSMIVDPWGRILDCAGTEERLLYGEVDLEYIEQVRKQIPVLDWKKERRSLDRK